MSQAMKADVAIIGGGLMGCAAALALRRMKFSVTLLEQGWCGAQASGVNYGGVRRQGRLLTQLPLAQRAHAIWQQLPQRVGCDGEYLASGHLRLARSEADLNELEHYREQARDYGLDLALLGRDALSQRYPWLSQQVLGASLCADDGQANPRLVAAAFAQAAKQQGAHLHEQTTVTQAYWDGTQFQVQTQQGRQISATYLLNCAGAWGAQFAHQFGETVPEYPTFPNMWVTEPRPKLVEPNIGLVGGALYLRQVARGNFVVGGGRGSGQLSLQANRASSESLFDTMHLAAELIPALAQALVIRSWTGVEGSLPDQQPVLGPSSTTAGLFHAFGFSGGGFQLAPAVGEVLAELVAHSSTTTPIQAFSIQRFSSTDFMDLDFPPKVFSWPRR